jgi:predicted Zn-dependent peptidase
MYRAASVELYNEPFRSLDEILALIDGISVDDVARVASVYFDPERMTVVSLGPKGAE